MRTKPPLTRGVGSELKARLSGICSYDYLNGKFPKKSKGFSSTTDFTTKGQKQIPPYSPLIKGGDEFLMLIAMAGLPASGKSTLAERLSEALDGVLLNKDEVRAFLFGERVNYSAEQNDLCMGVIYDVAVYLLQQDPETVVIVDGRTFSRTYQIDDLKEAAERAGTPLRIVECVCSEASTRERLEQSQNDHPAQDRDFSMYLKSKAAAEPIPQPKLVINTDERTPAEGVQDVLAYLENA